MGSLYNNWMVWNGSRVRLYQLVITRLTEGRIIHGVLTRLMQPGSTLGRCDDLMLSHAQTRST